MQPKETKPEAIRKQYEEKGVEGFYKEAGASYINPHFEEIKDLIIKNESRIDYTSVLDFCCGSGEVSMILRDLGYAATASDPFTQKAYQKNFNTACLNYSFEDVIKGKMEGQFSAIICSFAMHLCPDKQLFPLIYNLFQHSPSLIILSPHKRPELERFDQVKLQFEDFSLTERGKKVRLKAYQFKP